MYPKFRNYLMWSHVAEKTKGLAVKNPLLLSVNRGSDSAK